MSNKISTITHNLFLSLVVLLSLTHFLLAFFVFGTLKNEFDFLLLGLDVSVFIALFYYISMNVIKPARVFKTQLKKLKDSDLEEISAKTFDSINPIEVIIDASTNKILQLSNQISNATQFINEIENGKLDAEYIHHDLDSKNTNNPLSTALQSMRNQMILISEKENERNWTTEGLAKFADILRINTDNLKLFYDQLISNIINYLKANQGGLYIVNQDNENDHYLELVAYIAYERKKYIQQRVELSEGLLGRAYMEKDVILITDVPDNYIRITSGTGEATPKCILIVPLKLNEEIIGLIELASFQILKPFQIDFLLKLGESIASTISNVKTNERTHKLLLDTQLQAEQMRNQEEEMRQNMEELNSTQEEMQRSEQIHLQEIERLQTLHIDNLKEAQIKNEELKKAEGEAKELMAEIQASQEQITRNYNTLFEKFNEFNIVSKFDQLTSIRSTKKRNIEDYFNIIRSQIMTYSEDKMIVDAMKAFKQVFRNLGKDLPEKELTKMKNKVKSYYENEFLPKLNANSEDFEKLDKYWDNDPRTILMQYLYIANNPNETGKKHLLDTAFDGSDYSNTHEIYHPIIKNFLLTFGYYDIFLIDNETGHIIYSVFKEVDYTTSLLSGPYKNTNFAHVFREARNANQKEFIKLVDFEPYDPSYTAPASFIATPIYDGQEKIGVLVFQMPIDKINSIMTGDKKWKEDGLGNSGETYLVGEDYKMRSISRFLIEDPIGYFNELQRIGYNEQSIKRIKRLNTTILLQDVKTEAVINALRGNTDKKIVLDYRKISVLSAYAKLEIQDVNWVICSDIDEAEVLDSVAHMKEMALD